jgi:hypothetical protein
MWRLAILALLLCAAGCESTDFYHADTRSWFATPSPSSQASSPGAGGEQQPASQAP